MGETSHYFSQARAIGFEGGRASAVPVRDLSRLRSISAQAFEKPAVVSQPERLAGGRRGGFAVLWPGVV